MPQWETYLLAHTERHLAELTEFLRIPSISTLPEHVADVQRAARWVARRLEAAGVEGVAVLPTGGHPVVYGEWLHASGRPTVLIYGHFDVEPAGPAERWRHPPFEPRVANGRIYARGASDDKGNMLIPILAVEAWLKTAGSLPVNVRFCFEGQEEVGSPDLPAFVAAHRERLACDLVISADGGQWAEDQPALTLGCRGLCACQIDVAGPATDLHSGVYGGTVQNPIHALVRILDSLRRPDGTVAVAGFYDGVAEPDAAERAGIAAVPFAEEAYREALGVPHLFGEPGYTTLERSWVRPSLEVNGLWGGHQGPGVQAIVPAAAHAKVTCRLVAGQQAGRVLDMLEAHVARHAPRGARATVQRLPGVADPYLMDAAHPANRAAAGVLEAIYGKAPLTVRMGATIPVCALFRSLLGADTLMFAFGLDDEQIHAPNEFLRLASWERGKRAYGLLLERLGQ